MEPQPVHEQPLTARQLVKIIVAVAVITFLIWQAVASVAATRRADRVYDCAHHAPAAWDCARFPTGYPSVY